MYRYAEPRVGPMLIWCREHTPKRSQLSNSKMGPVWDAQDSFNVADAETVEDIKSAIEDVKTAAEEAKSDYEEGLENMPPGLQEGPTGQDIQEKIEALDSWISDLDSFVDDLGEDDQAREEVEREVIRTAITERGADPDFFDLDDSIGRHNLLLLMDYDLTEFETEVENQIEASSALDDAKEKAVEVVGGFEY